MTSISTSTDSGITGRGAADDQLNMGFSLGPCHPSAHGVFRLLLLLVGEIVTWIDTQLGLLHRSTELLCEHRYSSHMSGYLSRTDYVAHLMLESMTVTLGTRHRSSSRDMNSLLGHLTWLANHVLNITCSLGDLGCISLILWGFEDRESIFTELDSSLGTRLHTHLDALTSPITSSMDQGVTLLLTRLTSRWHHLQQLLMVRFNVDRVFAHCPYSMLFCLGSLYTGVHAQCSGFGSDLRPDCSGYSRATVSILTGGVMSCSLIRLLIRLWPPFGGFL